MQDEVASIMHNQLGDVAIGPFLGEARVDRFGDRHPRE
jgi:hypothetical protein